MGITQPKLNSIWKRLSGPTLRPARKVFHFRKREVHKGQGWVGVVGRELGGCGKTDTFSFSK